MKYWETIADKLSAAGWNWGYCSAVTRDGWRWIVDAYRGDGRRYIVESDELLTAFMELESTLLRSRDIRILLGADSLCGHSGDESHIEAYFAPVPHAQT